MSDVSTRRFFAELRSLDSGGGSNAIEGHAAVFDTFAEIGPDMLERLAPTAFDKVLANSPDVRALKNHDPNLVLGRTGHNLELSVDDVGLWFRIDPLPDTQAARDLREEMRQGLITGASFAFIPDEETFEQAGDNRFVRTHVSVGALLDVSPVTYPAYNETNVALRSLTVPILSSRAKLLRIRHRSRHAG